MGGKSSTSSGSYGGDDRGRDRNDRSIQAEVTGGKKKVKEEIKKSGTDMYGGVASKATNEYLESIGEATKGSQNPDGSYNYRLTGRGHKLKYGSYNPGGPQNPTGMGTVGADGIMNQIPISEKMFESQKKLKMAALLPLSVLAPFPVSTVLGLGAQEARKASYDNYINSFNKGGLIRETSSTSYAAKNNRDTSDATIQDTKAQAEANESAAVEAANLKKQAIARNQAALKGKRQFFSGTTKLIKGAMQ